MRSKLKRWIYFAIFVYIVCTILIWHADNGAYTGVGTETYMPSLVPNITAVIISINSSVGQMKTKAGKVINSTFDKISEIAGHVQSNCPGMTFPKNLVRDSWTSVWEDNIYVYSAFYESTKNEIRVIATRDRKKSSILHCHVWTENGTMSISRAVLQDLPEHKGKRYICSYYLCKTEVNMKPIALSLAPTQCGTSKHALFVQDDKPKRAAKFTVCVTPLNYKYSKAYELVEMVELNRILGADRIVFYNHTTNTNVESVLEHYKKLGIVDVHQWNLPMGVDTWPRRNPNVEVHYFAQISALNDCLNRERYKSDFLVYQDLDEFIIPRKVKNWTELFSKLPGGKSSYMFRNTFFRKDFKEDANFTLQSIATKYKLVTLLKQVREAKIFTRKHRSKYIINPRKIEILGIHSATRFRIGGGEYFVDPSEALLHHYRDWENPTDKAAREKDTRMMAFKDVLLQKVLIAWSSLKDIPLGPLS
ncbi:hypothetical protein FSP39_019480 [Pinctada imbricata]|uniref:Glycosyltransferase family 92 protein n=1 Tax=Pinctada imbricata TaxID=66713 RepID=A0AA88XS58_PINIB|nr:hypothetical protein FSP39_019480 [Pinctada imbricata]